MKGFIAYWPLDIEFHFEVNQYVDQGSVRGADGQTFVLIVNQYVSNTALLRNKDRRFVSYTVPLWYCAGVDTLQFGRGSTPKRGAYTRYFKKATLVLNRNFLLHCY